MPFDTQAAEQGLKTGASIPNRYTGLSEVIKAITNDLRTARADREATSLKKQDINAGIVQELIKKGYRPSDNVNLQNTLETGDLSGWTKQGASGFLQGGSGGGYAGVNVPLAQGQNMQYIPGKLSPEGDIMEYIPSPVGMQAAKDIEVVNTKRAAYMQDLQSFLSVDDVLQKSRGSEAGRFLSGIGMKAAGITRHGLTGIAMGQHEAARKRLRVQLVRAAGDVGNLNLVEQQAAEMLIPTEWDDARTAELKRAYLLEVGRRVNLGDSHQPGENGVKQLLDKFALEIGLDVSGLNKGTSGMVTIMNPADGEVAEIEPKYLKEYESAGWIRQ